MRTLVFFVVAFISCHKPVATDTTKTFSGIVLDYTTGDPIPGATVKIVRYPAASLFPEGIYPQLVKGVHTDLFRNIRVDSTVSDGQGKYTMDLDLSRPPVKTYFPGASREGYIHVFAKAPFQTAGEATVSDTIYLDRNSYLELVVNSLLPATGDTILIKTSYLQAGTERPYFRSGATDSILLAGPVNNLVITDTVSWKAFPQARVKWVLTRHGQTQEKDSVVDLIPFGTRQVRIDY